MKTINIKGKEYVPVNERVKEFRTNPDFADYSIETQMEQFTPDYCVIHALIRDPNGHIWASGYAMEERNASNINKTSFVENCETSAIGRALGMLGIGIDTAICTADELKNAIDAQEAAKAPIPESYLATIRTLLDDVAEVKDKTVDEVAQRVCEVWNVDTITELTAGQGIEVMRQLRKWAGKDK